MIAQGRGYTVITSFVGLVPFPANLPLWRLSKGYSIVDIMGSYAAKEGLHEDLPVVEAEGYRDEDDLAVFGKRPELKVRSSSPPWPWAR